VKVTIEDHMTITSVSFLGANGQVLASKDMGADNISTVTAAGAYQAVLQFLRGEQEIDFAEVVLYGLHPRCPCEYVLGKFPAKPGEGLELEVFKDEDGLFRLRRVA
jgi:hypothetical protein